MDSNEETATRQVFVVQKPAKNSGLAAILSFSGMDLARSGKILPLLFCISFHGVSFGF